MLQKDSERLLKEVEEAISFSDEQLYIILLPEDQSSLYSHKGRLIHGKRLFESALAKARPTICSTYRKIRDDVSELVELIVLLVLALQQDQQLRDLPLVPLCVLAARRGLDTLCIEG